MHEVAEIAKQISQADIEKMAEELAMLRHTKSKLWIIGLGGSMANAIHMAADLRKLCDINAEAFDNIAELTARANDEGLETIFVDWLSRRGLADMLMVLSVGGGTDKVSTAICRAIDAFVGQTLKGFTPENYGHLAMGIVGPDGGYTAQKAKYVVKIPAPAGRITPHTEAFQMVVIHCLVSHPLLQKRPTVW